MSLQSIGKIPLNREPIMVRAFIEDEGWDIHITDVEDRCLACHELPGVGHVAEVTIPADFGLHRVLHHYCSAECAINDEARVATHEIAMSALIVMVDEMYRHAMISQDGDA